MLIDRSVADSVGLDGDLALGFHARTLEASTNSGTLYARCDRPHDVGAHAHMTVTGKAKKPIRLCMTSAHLRALSASSATACDCSPISLQPEIGGTRPAHSCLRNAQEAPYFGTLADVQECGLYAGVGALHQVRLRQSRVGPQYTYQVS